MAQCNPLPLVDAITVRFCLLRVAEAGRLCVLETRIRKGHSGWVPLALQGSHTVEPRCKDSSACNRSGEKLLLAFKLRSRLGVDNGLASSEKLFERWHTMIESHRG